MKKFFKNLLGCGCFASIILAGAENQDGSCNVLWTLGFITLALVFAYGYKKLEEAR